MTILLHQPSARRNAQRRLTLFDQSDDTELMKHDVAADPSTSVDVLRELSMSQFSEIREAVAGNPSTPSDILSTLSKDFSEEVVLSVISNPNITSDILELIFLSDPTMLFASPIAANPVTPQNILRTLAEKAYDSPIAPSPRTVISNPSLPEDCMAKFMEHSSPQHRSEIANNPNIPVHLLDKLTKDEHIYVHEAARINRIKRALNTDEYRNCPIEWLEEMFGFTLTDAMRAMVS